MHVFSIVLVVVGSVALAVGIGMAIADEIQRYGERRWAVRRAAEAEWRIHQIASDAKARMWDEAQHPGAPR